MVKNLEELLVEATKWANDAKNELKKKVEDFIETTGSSEEELAGVLGISLGEMEQILHGNGEVTITTLSKLLVATNNAVEIKPVEETPIGRYGTATTTHEHPSNQFLRATATPPSRDELPEGRFTPHVNPSQFDFDDDIDDFGDGLDEEIGDGFDEEIDEDMYRVYGSLDDETLCDMIRRNLWTEEINTETASHDELTRFLCKKEMEMAEIMRTRAGSPCNDRPHAAPRVVEDRPRCGNVPHNHNWRDERPRESVHIPPRPSSHSRYDAIFDPDSDEFKKLCERYRELVREFEGR